MGEEEKQSVEPTSPGPTPSGGTVSGGMKALFIILAILFPIVGIILGIIWLKKDTKEEKALGKMTLIISIILIVLQCVCWILFFSLGILGGVSDFSMLLPALLAA
ncbi:MAG: hypothetical protein E3J78_07530 [Candidatus Cloacimonadota bacterium]|nr:MAG: hypothetical protein E3J78_07530 [Candidatus Cloacimonadota bacterium]